MEHARCKKCKVAYRWKASPDRHVNWACCRYCDGPLDEVRKPVEGDTLCTSRPEFMSSLGKLLSW